MCAKNLEYRPLDENYMDDVVNLMKTTFFSQNEIFRALGFENEPKAVDELDELILDIVKQGISVVVFDKVKNKIAGLGVYEIQSASQDEHFEKYKKTCKFSSTRRVLDFFDDTDIPSDTISLNSNDFLLEIIFIVVLTEYRNCGIGKELIRKGLQLAEKLHNGEQVLNAINGKEIQLKNFKGVWAVTLNQTAKHIFNQMGIASVKCIPNGNLFYDGKSLRDYMNNVDLSITFHYKQF